jgi:hypothetical protein
MIFIGIIKYLFLTLLAIILLILFVPFDYHIKGKKEEMNLSLEGSFAWLFGGVKVSISNITNKVRIRLLWLFSFTTNMGKTNGEKDSIKGKTTKEKASEESKKSRRRTNPLTYINRELIELVKRTMKRIYKYIKPDELFFEGDIGFEDPYYTGILSAIVYSSYRVPKGYYILINPVFDKEVYDGKLEIKGRLVMALILWSCLTILLTRPVFNIILKERKERLCH